MSDDSLKDSPEYRAYLAETQRGTNEILADIEGELVTIRDSLRSIAKAAALVRNCINVALAALAISAIWRFLK